MEKNNGFPKDFRCVSNGLPMILKLIFPWFSIACLIKFQWNLKVLQINLKLISDQLPIDFLQVFKGSRLDVQWIPQGFLMDYKRIFSGKPKDFKWIPVVFVRDFNGFVTDMSSGFLMGFRWIPIDSDFTWMSNGF